MIRLRELRTQHGLTLDDLSEKLHVNKSTLSRIENGQREPKQALIKDCAELFNVSTDFLLGNSPDSRQEVHDYGRGVRVPVLGSVAAGIPLEAIEDVQDWEEIPASMAARGEYIALTIHGSSMEPRMREGDVVIVRLQDDVESGDIALVYINGNDATCKKVVKAERGIWLKGLNDTFEPLWFSWEDVQSVPVKIAGKVVELRAKF